MAIIEVQIRTDRFCELVKHEINFQVLAKPKMEFPEAVKGKWLEKIECRTCTLSGPSAGSGTVTLSGELAIKYHDSLDNIRAAGSLQPPPTAELLNPFWLKIAFENNLKNPTLRYDLSAFKQGTFPLELPADISAQCLGIEATESVVAIRIGTEKSDPIFEEPVSRLGTDEWVQIIPGALIAETVRRVLNRALDEAVLPPQIDPMKPWLPKPKPEELRKDAPARAAWIPVPIPFAFGQGELIAVNACPALPVNIAIELSLSVRTEFPDLRTLKTTAVLTWNADSTWCDVFSSLFFTPLVGVAFHIGAESEVSDSILGRKPSPGDGFEEVGPPDKSSITFERVAWAPSAPSREFICSRAEVTGLGLLMGGVIKPKVAPALAGEVSLPSSELDLDCRLRAAGMVLSPAQVALRNSAIGYVGQPPSVFLEHTMFEPAGAWAVETDFLKMFDPTDGSPQTVLKFVDPPTGRLPVGTPTAVFLFTDYGVRWVDLGVVPELTNPPPHWAEQLMHKYCDSISNPWGRGMTQLGWVDPLVDPDDEHRFGLERVRLWRLGLRDLPESVRIELLAITTDGTERLLGIVEGQRSAALELVTDANETLALRPERPFAAPPPTLTRVWVYPFAAQAFDSEPEEVTWAAGSLGITHRDGTTRVVDPRELGNGHPHTAGSFDARHLRPATLLAHGTAQRRKAWATAVHLNKDTVAVTHRGRVLVGMLGQSRRIQ